MRLRVLRGTPLGEYEKYWRLWFSFSRGGPAASRVWFTWDKKRRHLHLYYPWLDHWIQLSDRHHLVIFCLHFSFCLTENCLSDSVLKRLEQISYIPQLSEKHTQPCLIRKCLPILWTLSFHGTLLSGLWIGAALNRLCTAVPFLIEAYNHSLPEALCSKSSMEVFQQEQSFKEKSGGFWPFWQGYFTLPASEFEFFFFFK